MEIKKGTKLKLKWQLLNDGEPVALSDYAKFRLDVLDKNEVPQRTSVNLADSEIEFCIDTAKYATGRFSVRVDADGPNGGLHIHHRNAFKLVPANTQSYLAQGGNGANIELTIQDDLSGQTQSVVEEQDPTVPDHVKAITQQNITDWGKNIFWCDFGVTTSDEITTALNNGKLPVVYVDDSHFCVFSHKDSNAYIFVGISPREQSLYGASLERHSWYRINPMIFETIDLKKSSWSTAPNDYNYPSEKLVYDSLALKQEKLPSLEGNAGKVLRVKADETGVEWVSID